MQSFIKGHEDMLATLAVWRDTIAALRVCARKHGTTPTRVQHRRSRAPRHRLSVDDIIVHLDTVVQRICGNTHTTTPASLQECKEVYRSILMLHAPELAPPAHADVTAIPPESKLLPTPTDSNPSTLFEHSNTKHHIRTLRKDRADSLQQRRGSFRAALQYYQGKGSNPVPQRVMTFIRQRLVANKRSFAGVSRAHIACILRSSRRPSFSRYYRDISHIHASITGQQPPDVSRYETDLMLMFDSGIFLLFSKSWAKCTICCMATTIAL